MLLKFRKTKHIRKYRIGRDATPFFSLHSSPPVRTYVVLAAPICWVSSSALIHSFIHSFIHSYYYIDAAYVRRRKGNPGTYRPTFVRSLLSLFEVRSSKYVARRVNGWCSSLQVAFPCKIPEIWEVEMLFTVRFCSIDLVWGKRGEDLKKIATFRIAMKECQRTGQTQKNVGLTYVYVVRK